MEIIKLGDKEITISELNAEDASKVNTEVLLCIVPILEACADWDKSTFELVIEQPELFLKLLAISTGQKKKYIRSLPGKDFDSLAFVFLSVNAEFFIQRLKLIQMAA